ncbi:MAG: GFA family protein [Alphaproteobacteria bacterium]|nr:GFA family protein [Alphaproteobacteria bacterium]
MTPQSCRCLCGAVTFRATPAKPEMGACHCGMCRHWSGGVFFGVDCTGPIEFASEEALGVYASSDYGERCFCKQCGSTLIWRMRDGSHAVVSVQAFPDPGAFRFASEIFIDEKPDSYSFANDTKRMSGAEFIAQFMS